jgi:hypothetical protein
VDRKRLLQHCPAVTHVAAAEGNKKADMLKYPAAFQHVGILFDEFPGATGLPFI